MLRKNQTDIRTRARLPPLQTYVRIDTPACGSTARKCIALLLAGNGAENPAALVRSGQTQDNACRMALQSRCAGAVSLSVQEFNDADVPEPPLVATEVRTRRVS